MAGRHGDGGVHGLGKRQRLLMRATGLDAAARDDERPLGLGEQAGGFLDQRRIATREAVRAHLPLHRPRLQRHLLGEEIARHVEDDGALARRQCRAESLVDELRNAGRLWQRPGLLRDTLEELLLVDLLEGIAIDVRRRERTCEGHDGRVGGAGLRDAGDEIGDTGPVLAGKDDARLAARPRVAVGHVRAGPLVAHADEGHALGIVDGVEHLHGGGADEAEDVADALLLESLDDRLATCDACHCQFVPVLLIWIELWPQIALTPPGRAARAARRARA